MSETQKTENNILRQLIYWVGGAFSLSTVCYIAGFIAKRSHLNVLSVSGVDVSPIEYLVTGAKFIFYSLICFVDLIEYIFIGNITWVYRLIRLIILVVPVILACFIGWD